MRSDNLRPPTDPRLAAGALKVADAFARGTAMVPTGHAIMSGKTVRYRALSGEVYDAKIVVVQSIDHVVLDVTLPGCSEPVRLTNVQLVRDAKP